MINYKFVILNLFQNPCFWEQTGLTIKKSEGK